MSNTLRPPTKLTVVEEGTEFKGVLTSSCPIDVRGRVEGELQTPVLTVSETGAVHGRAKVGAVRSQGEISGEFDAEKVELSGVVRDNTVIRAHSLDVKLCAERGKLQIVFGECELSVGAEPTESDHVAVPDVAPAPDPIAAQPELVAAEPAQVVPAPLPEASAAPADSPSAALLLPAASPADAALAAAPVPAPAADAEIDAEEGDDEAPADAAEAGAAGGKRKRKRKNGQEEASAGWSQAPSQPPPAN